MSFGLRVLMTLQRLRMDVASSLSGALRACGSVSDTILDVRLPPPHGCPVCGSDPRLLALRRVLHLKMVTQCAMLEDFGIFLVLADKVSMPRPSERRPEVLNRIH